MTTPYPDADIIANTEPRQLTLLPELLVRVLRLDGEWCREDSGPFEDEVFPYWLFAWAAGQAMARYLLDHPECVRGRTVLDFGAGCGIASIAAAMADARCVIASDIDPNALSACRINAALNGVALEYCHEFVSGSHDVQVLLGSDVFYHWPQNDSVLQQLSSSCQILVSFPEGRDLPLESQLRAHGLQHLHTYDARTIPTLERADIKRAGVFAVQSGTQHAGLAMRE
jgi:predicted nicotinamide N-methyase